MVLLAAPLYSAMLQGGNWQRGGHAGAEAQSGRGYGRQPEAQPGGRSRGEEYRRPSEGRGFDGRSYGSGPEYRQPRQYNPPPDYRERPGYGSTYGYDRPAHTYQGRPPEAYGQHGLSPDRGPYPSGRPEAGRPDLGGRQPYGSPSQYPGHTRPSSPYAAPNSAPARVEQPAVRGEGPRHGDWLRNQMRLPPDEQERRLEQDPYYRSLPTDRQIELRGRLKRFNALPPEQRQRVMDRMEMIERMPPEQQRQTHELFRQFRGMDSERKDMVRRTLRQMRTMPPDARERFLNSPTTQSHFSPEEMQMLRGFNSLGFVERER